MVSNKFDWTNPLHLESYNRGRESERLFMKTANLSGWNCIKSLPEDDRIEHWDFMINGFNQMYRVEVKSRKKISRGDPIVQDNYIWVEMKSNKHQGWLYGKSDLIAFEVMESFILVKRIDLIKKVKDKVRFKFVDKPYDALYKLYRHTGTFNLLTLLKIKDIFEIIYLKFDK